ncbi:MAG: methyltransferase family protein [Promethearchaeota archaeon]|jgi:protein-S-isoprenylcysteine O-methyltransferase Ste14
MSFIVYWSVLSKIEDTNNRNKTLFFCAYPKIRISSMCAIPIINSSFFSPLFSENVSFFWNLWIWFLILGLIFIFLGLKINLAAKRLLKRDISDYKTPLLKTKGVYEIARHPGYFSEFLIFLGLSFIWDSFLGLILCPVVFILLEINSILEEKYLLTIQFGDAYEKYKNKTPYRLISPPYNYLLYIIAIIIVYIGFLNFDYIF